MIDLNRESFRGRRAAGFTLIEVIMVMVLLGILTVSAFMAATAWVHEWRVYVCRRDMTGEAAAALNRMVREIRMVRSRADIPVNKDANGVDNGTATRFRFVDVDGHTMTFSYDDDAKILYRSVDDAEPKALAMDVEGFRFTYVGYGNTGLGDLAEYNGSTQTGRVYLGGYTNIRLVRIQMTIERDGTGVTLRTGVAPRNLQMK